MKSSALNDVNRRCYLGRMQQSVARELCQNYTLLFAEAYTIIHTDRPTMSRSDVEGVMHKLCEIQCARALNVGWVRGARWHAYAQRYGWEQ